MSIGDFFSDVKETFTDIFASEPAQAASIFVPQIRPAVAVASAIDKPDRPAQESEQPMIRYDAFGDPIPQQPRQMGGFFGGLRDFAGDVLGTLREFDPIAEAFGGDILPESAQTSGQQVARETRSGGAQENASSGTIQAGPGMLIQPGMSVARNLLQRYGGGVAGGLAAGEVIDATRGYLAGGGKRRITRKMKADVRRIYMMSGGNAAATAQIYNNLTGSNLNAQMVFAILLKRFRNDGPYVTKAAVRKTKSTVRKLKHMCDMYDDIAKAKRAPARRRTTRSTTITNVK